jgi:hypothetical protein
VSRGIYLSVCLPACLSDPHLNQVLCGDCERGVTAHGPVAALQVRVVSGNVSACVSCRANPYKENALDGVNLDPLEAVFVKVKAHLLELRWPAQRAAAAYDRWLAAEVQPSTVCRLISAAES